MPPSGSGEIGSGPELLRCPSCGAETSRPDRFCRSCGAEQSAGAIPADQTEPLTGAEAEGGDLEPPTEETTQAEPPTERRPPPPAHQPPEPRPPRLERPPPPPVDPPRPTRLRPGSARRRLIAIAVAVLLGLLAGLAVVIAVNGDGGGEQAAGTQTGGAPATALDPVETLAAHFDLLEQGRFLAASDDLTPELLDSLGGRTFWVAERIADLLIDAQLDASVAEETDSTATVRVASLRTESLAGGCTDFSGTYSLVRSGDRWLIDSADLIDRPC